MKQNIHEQALILLKDPQYMPSRSDLEKLLSWYTTALGLEDEATEIRHEREIEKFEKRIEELDTEIDELYAKQTAVDELKDILAVDSLTGEIFMRGVAYEKDLQFLKLPREVKKRL